MSSIITDTNVSLSEKELTSQLSKKINKDWKDNIRRELNDPLLAQYRQEQKKAHWDENKKLPGMTKDKSMRKVAEVPFYIWKAMKNIFGDDYWRKRENLRRHPEFWVIDNYK